MEKYKIWYLACIVIICSNASFGTSSLEEDIFWAPQILTLNKAVLKRMDEKQFFTSLVPGVFDNKISSNKRGFSMLARWKPFNHLAKQRASIRDVTRSYFGHPEPDVVSAETRAYFRPSGQPLRWG